MWPTPNMPIFLIGIFFWFLETRYFGWNGKPMSIEELACDGIALGFIALSFLKFGGNTVTVNVTRTDSPPNGSVTQEPR